MKFLINSKNEVEHMTWCYKAHATDRCRNMIMKRSKTLLLLSRKCEGIKGNTYFHYSILDTLALM